MMKKLFDNFRKFKQDVQGRLTELQHTEEGLRRERDALLAQPAAKSDIKAMLDSWLTRQGLQYRDQLQEALQFFILRPQQIANAQDTAISIAGPAIEPAGAPTAKNLDQLLVALLGPTLRPVLMAMVDAMPFEQGPPMAERAKKIAELDAQLAKVRSEIQELADEAAAAGISLD